MKDYYEVLKDSALFCDIETENIPTLFRCLDASVKSFNKNQSILLVGNPANRIGVVLEGSVSIVRDDAMGERTILTTCKKGDIFGEAFAFAEIPSLPISVIANQNTKVLLLNSIGITNTCALSCGFHNTLIKNLVKIFAFKNITLTQKNEVLSSRKIRDKLITYCSILSSRENSNIIEIPFDRQGLADYLSVNRSAMSTEISKMCDEGIISVHKNKFKLLKIIDQ